MTLTKDKNKNAGGLKGRLEDYSSSARAGGATRATLRQHLGNWPIYAAATGSAMAMAQIDPLPRVGEPRRSTANFRSLFGRLGAECGAVSATHAASRRPC